MYDYLFFNYQRTNMDGTCRLREILSVVFILVLSLVIVKSESTSSSSSKYSNLLSVDFYNTTCPNVESIVLATMLQKFNETPTVAAGVLRIMQHDCFVEGCDASILLVSTPNNTAEKDAEINLSLSGNGFDAVIRAKSAVEAQCPGVVSCADIIVISARDLVSLVGGPFFPVLKGRRDGTVSQASRIAGNIPTPDMSLDEIIQIFSYKGLGIRDLVTLLGAHTIGFAHCTSFINRLYNFSSTSQVDPSLDPQFAHALQQTCPPVNFDPTAVTFNDPTTPFTFDNVYYKNAQRGLSVMSSDQVLFLNPRTRGIVNHFASNEETFFSAFVTAIQHMGSMGVKTGMQGEIRKDCAFVNS
ncbi:hypothetical protein O6H91_09G035800 [Diphasiastrum complanatum]|uniref:Uncharacterized protein n=1 Tax=Diphasiastrum complanatum TaxID=34168 RepID=A0ACC2CN28_DIPCM|nr:hypothetical protein O6H91_09G035800 [Diphasiastrum complanatum]